MKRVLKTLCLVFLVVFFTGCVKQNIHMDVSSKEVTIKITDAMESSVRTEEELSEVRTQYEELGFTVTDYNSSENGDSYTGVVASKTFKLDDVSSSEPVEFHLENLGTEKLENPKIFQKKGNTYKATLILDTVGSDSGDYEELASYASVIDISYSVTLPEKAISHNADVVEDTTYTWNVTYGEVAEINYEFKTAGSSIVLYIVIGVAIIAVIVVVVLLVLKNKKGNSTPKMSQSNVMTPPTGAEMSVPNTMPSSTEPVMSVSNTVTQPVSPVIQASNPATQSTESMMPTSNTAVQSTEIEIPASDAVVQSVQPEMSVTTVEKVENSVVEPSNSENQNMQ